MMSVYIFVCFLLLHVAVCSEDFDNSTDICTAQCYAKCLQATPISHHTVCEEQLEQPQCNCHTDQSGFIPPLPRLDILGKMPLVIGWPNNGDILVCPGCVFVLQRKFNGSENVKWIRVNITTALQYVSNDMNDICRAQVYRLAAVSPSGSLGFSNVLVVEGQTTPGPVFDLHWTSGVNYVQGYFEAKMEWSLPQGWSEKEIKNYKTNYIVKYRRPGSMTATPIITKEDGCNAMTVKLSQTVFGTIYEFSITPVSYCNRQGSVASILMKLKDCEIISGYECPTTPAPKPKLVGPPDVFGDQSHPAMFFVSWKSTPDNVDRYALQWGSYSYIYFGFSTVINQTVVDGKITSVWIDVNGHSAENFGIKIIPLVDGQDDPTAQTWGLKLIYPLVVQNPPGWNPTDSAQPAVPLPPGASSTPHKNETTTWSGDTTTSISRPFSGFPPKRPPPPRHPPSRRPPQAQTEGFILAMSVSVPVTVVLVIGAIVVAFMCYKQKRKKKKRKTDLSIIDGNFNYYKSVIANEKNPLYPQCSLIGDELEIPNDCLIFGDVLGQGAFGMVKQAVLVQSKWSAVETTVAVKMMLEHASDSQKQEFLQEISIMKQLGKHAHIVSMIGYCSVTEPLFVVVEHMCNGDLVHYLRRHRSPSSDNDVFDTRERLTFQDLLSFARQICIGMEFLSQKGYVHRDLAARNVLVGDSKNIKIGDFGLTRYIYDDKVYCNRKGGKLPLKWMSIEAISDLTFTAASDVWSFGVLLFELVTLGGTPYPTISNHDLLKDLKMGYRMERPESCPKQLYSIMLECWHHKGSMRPTFTRLRDRFDHLLEASCPDDYLDLSLDVDKDYYRMRGSSESIETSDNQWDAMTGSTENVKESDNVSLVSKDEDHDEHWVVEMNTRL